MRVVCEESLCSSAALKHTEFGANHEVCLHGMIQCCAKTSEGSWASWKRCCAFFMKPVEGSVWRKGTKKEKAEGNFWTHMNFQTKYKLSKSMRCYTVMSYFCNIWIAPVSNQTSFVCHMLFCNMQMVVARIFRNYQKVFSRLYQLFYDANIDSTCHYPITSLSCRIMQSC